MGRYRAYATFQDTMCVHQEYKLLIAEEERSEPETGDRPERKYEKPGLRGENFLLFLLQLSSTSHCRSSHDFDYVLESDCMILSSIFNIRFISEKAQGNFY